MIIAQKRKFSITHYHFTFLGVEPLAPPADPFIERIPLFQRNGMVRAHLVGAIFHGEAGSVFQGREDVIIVGDPVFSLDGINGDLFVGHSEE